MPSHRIRAWLEEHVCGVPARPISTVNTTLSLRASLPPQSAGPFVLVSFLEIYSVFSRWAA